MRSTRTVTEFLDAPIADHLMQKNGGKIDGFEDGIKNRIMDYTGRQLKKSGFFERSKG